MRKMRIVYAGASVEILKWTVSPALTLIWVANPSIVSSSHESHSSGCAPASAFSAVIALGPAPAPRDSGPRPSVTAPALAAAPLRKVRLPKPIGATPSRARP